MNNQQCVIQEQGFGIFRENQGVMAEQKKDDDKKKKEEKK